MLLFFSSGLGASIRATATVTATITLPVSFSATITPSATFAGVLASAMVKVNGVDRSTQFLKRRSEITQQAGGQDWQATLAFRGAPGWTPHKGDTVWVREAGVSYFYGRITRLKTERPRATTRFPRYVCECAGLQRQLNMRLASFTWEAVSASTAIADLLAGTAFSSAGVQAGLPVITLTLDNEFRSVALDEIMQAVGGAWYIDPDTSVVYAWIGVQPGAIAPAAITATNTRVRNLEITDDETQIRTRIVLRGAAERLASIQLPGVTTLPRVLSNGETLAEIPVNDGARFSASGGLVNLGNQAATYAGKSANDGWEMEIAGPTLGVFGNVPFLLTGSASGRVWSTTYGALGYKMTALLADAWGNDLGESEISSAYYPPFGSGQVAAPAGGGFATPTTGGGLTIGSTYYYKMSYVTPDGETTPTAGPGVILNWVQNAVSLTALPVSYDSRVTARNIYRTKAGGGANYYRVGSVNDNTTTTYLDTTPDTSLVSLAPALNTTGWTLTLSIRVGFGFQQYICRGRKLYRTKADNPVRFYELATILDNTTAVFIDNIPDANLGDEAPTTSRATTLPGATMLRTTFQAGPLDASGWIKAGGSLVRYAGRSSDSWGYQLTGIPPSGVGSVTTQIPAGTTATMLPFLTGVAGLTRDLDLGASVSLRAVRDDLAAQARIAAEEGTDGIHEFPLADESLTTVAALNQRGDAELALGSTSLVTIAYTTDDLQTRAGRLVPFAIADYTGSMLIQSVRIYWDEHRRTQFAATCASQVRDLYQILHALERAAA